MGTGRRYIARATQKPAGAAARSPRGGVGRRLWPVSHAPAWARSLALGLAFLLAASLAADARAQPTAVAPMARLSAPAEVRGTWMTTTANDAISTPEKTAESMRRLREIGLNTVYVECWKNGYTEFPSPTMDRLIGVPMRINGAGEELQRDLLEETLIEAHRNGLVYIAWFEYGFMAAYQDTHNDLRRRYEDWMTRTRTGGLVSDPQELANPFVWLNPLRPESRDLLMGIVLDAVDRYDLDGVQLDDRIAWPITMGYDDFTVAAYKAEHNGQAPPDDPRDRYWIKWRADKVTAFAKRFHDELKARRPHLIVSISPAIWDWCYDNYACDWKTWSHLGWMDEYIPQIYRTTFERVRSDWPAQLEAVGAGRERDLIAGLRMVGAGDDTPWEDYRRKIELVREMKGPGGEVAGGHCHWFSRGVLEVYPEELTRFYDVRHRGQAPHPHLPQVDGRPWRPMPIVMSRAHRGGWVAEDVPAGDYRLIVQRDGRWSVHDTLRHGGGALRFADNAQVDAEAVELLVDRRTYRPEGD